MNALTWPEVGVATQNFQVHFLHQWLKSPFLNFYIRRQRLVYLILSVSCELLCINWNEPQAAAYITQAAFEQGLSTSWWIQATRSAVTT